MASAHEDGGRPSGQGDHNYAKMVDPIVVSTDHEESYLSTIHHPKLCSPSSRYIQETPSVSQTSSSLFLEGQDSIPLSYTAKQLIQGSLRESTKTKYRSIVNKWKNYCKNNDLPTEATTNSYVNFLAAEFD